MGKYKNFGELNKGDFVFSTVIANSSLEQNCIGEIYNRYIINDKYLCNNKLTLKLVADKSTFIHGWKYDPDNHQGEFSIEVMPDELIYAMDKKSKDENKISKTFYSTNIEDIQKNVEQIIETIEKQTIEMASYLGKCKDSLSNMKLNFAMRKDMRANEFAENNKKPKYQEVVTLDAVYV
jgi:poly(A) polymerase Pap1